jgi:FG-GAP-like repeat/RTX calcium-binding nonapeptide repeat (4 copies)/FG-GAP repeat
MSVPPEMLSSKEKSAPVPARRKRRHGRLGLQQACIVEAMEPRRLLDAVSFHETDYPLPGGKAQDVAVATLAGDGTPELITGYEVQKPGVNYSAIRAVLANGDGTFPTTPTSNQATYSIAGGDLLALTAGDINGDGFPDVILAKSAYVQANTATDISPSIDVLLGGNGSTTVGSNTATTSLTKNQQISLTNPPTALTLGDINGDGVPDLVITYGYSDSVAVLIQGTTGSGSTLVGTGQFIVPTVANSPFQAASPVLTQIPVGQDPVAAAVADLSGNGIDDIVTANRTDNTVSVLLGTGNGSFLPQQTYPVGSSPSDILITDLNHDGIPDIITTNAGSNNISVLLGNGNGTFQPAETFAVGADPVSLATGDFTGAGIPDLVVGNSTGQSISILLGNGGVGGTFTFQPAQNIAVNGAVSSVAAADVNGDGKLDVLATATTHSTVNTSQVYGSEVVELLNTNTDQPGISLSSQGVLTADGTSGDDTINLTTTGTVLTVQINSTVRSFPQSEVGAIFVNGLSGNDSITIGSGIGAALVGGGQGRDTIVSHTHGDETLQGGQGDDSITGGPGNDLILGGAGDDTLQAGSGNDTIRGQQGNDSILGGAGSNLLAGSLGNDTIIAAAGPGFETLVGGQGADSIITVRGTRDSVLPGTGGDDTVTGA